jgi:hypothetical protein
MQLRFAFEPLPERYPRRAPPLAPLYLSERELRKRVIEQAASSLGSPDKSRQVEAILQTVKEAVADDDIIEMLINSLKSRVQEHIDLAIDISVAGVTPFYSGSELMTGGPGRSGTKSP